MKDVRSNFPDARSKLPQFKVEGGPLHHIAPSSKGSLVLVGGSQVLVTLKLHSESRDGHDPPVFYFEKKRQLRAPGGLRPSWTGVSFLPGSDAIAASCTSNGHIFMWDTLGRRADGLLKQWQGHGLGKVTCLEFLPRVHDSRLVSADNQGHIYVWKLDRDLWEPGEDKGARSEATPMEERLSTSAPQRQFSPPYPHVDNVADQTPPSKDILKCHPHAVHDIHVQPSGNGVQMLIAQEWNKATIIDLQQSGQSSKDYFVASKTLLTARFHPHCPSIFGAATKDEQFVHILDSRLNNKDNRGVQSLRVGAAVGCIRWRPDRPEQLAASGGMSDVIGTDGASTQLLIWDLRRPYVPLHRFNTNGTALPDFFWADTNHLVSCGKDSTVQLHSVASSIQPLKATCGSSASWSVGSDGSERLALIADEIDREAEPLFDQGSIYQEFSYALHFGTFSKDVGLQSGNFGDISIELQKNHECIRCCGVFSTGQLGKSDDELKLQELLSLAPLPPRNDTASIAELCTQEAHKCLSKGMNVRAQTWKLLAKVTCGSDMKPFDLLSMALLGDDRLTSPDAMQFARGAGACVAGISKELLSPKQSHLSTISDESPVSVNLRTWQHTWRMQTLNHIIQFHEERNDVGMLLSLVAVFGIGGKEVEAEDQKRASSDEIDPKIRRRVFRWTQGAADILSKFQAFVPRTALFRAIPLENVQQLVQRDTKFYLRCCGVRNGCKQMFEPTRGCLARPNQKASRSNDRSLAQNARSCQKCKIRRKVCIICGEEVRGLWTACQVCGHGGHMHHMREWFASGNTQCPGGCGHCCIPPL